MKRFLSDLIWDTRGDTAVIFSISALAIFLGCGAAVDYSRWNNANTTASTVADAAALAAVASADAGEATMIAVAQKYIEENAAAAKLTLTTDPTFTYDKTTTEFTVELEGSIPASLMSLAGFSTLDVKAKSVAVKPEIPPVEMALVLDTTGSMAGTKIAALKTSADKMVTSVLKNKKAKIGIVPFSNYVNVGVSRRHDAFFDVPDDYTKTVSSCSTTYPDKKNCSIKSEDTTCSGTNDGVPYSYACTKKTEICESWGTPVKSCKDVEAVYKFYGCVGSREESVRDVLTDSTKQYPGFLNVGCAAEIQDLTSNLAAAKAKVSGLVATGETYMPAGLTWGWNMLTSAEPLTSAEDATTLAAKGGRKVMVLMTDGVTTLIPATKSKTSHVGPGSSVYKSLDYANTLSASLCKNIKQDGIDIYTVQFDVVDAKLQKLLTECATSPDMSYQASNASELAEAFDNILLDLAQVRIVR